MSRSIDQPHIRSKPRVHIEAVIDRIDDCVCGLLIFESPQISIDHGRGLITAGTFPQAQCNAI